jgi:hypothetical protein
MTICLIGKPADTGVVSGDICSHLDSASSGAYFLPFGMLSVGYLGETPGSQISLSFLVLIGNLFYISSAEEFL